MKVTNRRHNVSFALAERGFSIEYVLARELVQAGLVPETTVQQPGYLANRLDGLYEKGVLYPAWREDEISIHTGDHPYEVAALKSRANANDVLVRVFLSGTGHVVNERLSARWDFGLPPPAKVSTLPITLGFLSGEGAHDRPLDIIHAAQAEAGVPDDPILTLGRLTVLPLEPSPWADVLPRNQRLKV